MLRLIDSRNTRRHLLRLLLATGGHLLANYCLISVLHLVQIVCLQVVEQDCKASHELGLFFDASTTARQVHLVTYPVYLFVIKLDAAALS